MSVQGLNLAGELAEMMGAEAVAVALTFFFMGVMVLAGLSRLYRRVFRRPETYLTWRYTIGTALWAGSAILVWGIFAVFPDAATNILVWSGAFLTAMAWFRLMVVSVRLLALFRRQAILGGARLGAAVIPVQGRAAAPPVPGVSAREGPIRSIPSLGKRLENGLSGGKLLQWAPVAAGMVVMLVSAALFKHSGLNAGPGLPEGGAVDLGRAMWQSPLIIFGTLGIGAAVLLLVSRFAARRKIAYQDDPWLRLERMATAERAKR